MTTPNTQEQTAFEFQYDKRHECRVKALLAMPEHTVKVLWGQVVARHTGLNWTVGGNLNAKRLGPEQAADALMP